jgi:protein-S-isoprenylcysteine O-methyltransferase Ste14
MSRPPADPAPSGRKRSLRLPPLVVAPLVALLMWLVARGTPAWSIAFPGIQLVAWALLASAMAVGMAGLAAFRNARTTVNPLQPDKASALVTNGIYRHTRNPMYLAVAMVLLAWGLLLGHAVAPCGVAVFVAWMNRYQIAPEERALAGLFGAEFERYRREVRRWL